MPTPATALYTVAQTRAIDAWAISNAGIPGATLMLRASAGALAVLRQRWPAARRIVVLCGLGNNGGDGFLLATQARSQGLDARVVALPGESRGDAVAARRGFLDGGGELVAAARDASLPAADVYVDALFGSGLSRPLEGLPAVLVERLNAGAVPVLSLDVPSGLDADRGACTGPAVCAAATACFVAWKRGLFTGLGTQCCGETSLHTLQVPAAAYDAQRADAELLQVAALPPRGADSHKGLYGHVLAIGGDRGMSGALRLCTEAALRCGAGLVSAATCADGAVLAAGRPELMIHEVAGEAELQPLLERSSVLALGPGLGQGDWGRTLWRAALAAGKPIVVDADGLNLLAAHPRTLPRAAVLTPHPGEAARLLGCSTGAVQADRFSAVRELASRFGVVAVLKGSGSLVAAPDGRVAVCPWGNPGMASGGMGDLLTGVIAALMAQRLEPWDAACLGVGLHARAGDVAARTGQRGLLASDLLEPLRCLLNGIRP
ncbi:MAG TPA: NAD(P)H-hydrate dehydratase [Rhodanobacteraceae bacterium]|nr:NAD(P)H-hydrate dehydratase [Rhodanobacteraceae bacterium]